MRILHIASWSAQFVKNDIQYMNKFTDHENFYFKVRLLNYYGNNVFLALVIFFLNVVLSTYQSLLIRRLNVDIIHCHFIPPILAAFFAQKPTLVLTNESANAYPKIWIYFFRFFLKNAILINISAYNRDYWSELLKREGIIIYYAIDLENFNPKINGNELKIKLKNELNCNYIIMAMGSMNEDKGFDKIIEAISKIHQHSSLKIGLVLKVYGKGDVFAEILQNLIRTRSVPVKIISKFLSTEELAKLLSGSDIFIRSNKHEGFGIAPLEAMACGTPLILTKMGCHLEIFGGPGLLYDFNDVDNLTVTIERLLTDEKFREERIEKGIKRSKYFSWNIRINQFLKIYKKIPEK